MRWEQGEIGDQVEEEEGEGGGWQTEEEEETAVSEWQAQGESAHTML